MEGEAGELHDWELLHDSDESGFVNSSDSIENMRDLEGIVGESEGMIRTDYFSLDSQSKYVKTTLSDEGSFESDNPSWVDPESETRYMRKESGEFWPDSGSDRSDDVKCGEFDDKNELGFVENVKKQMGFEGIEQIGSDGENLPKFLSGSGGTGRQSLEFGEFQHDFEMSKGSDANSHDGEELSGGGGDGDGSAVGDVLSRGNEIAETGVMKSGGDNEKRTVVWWKIPFELLKLCAFRVSPVWTFSVAAAVMGFVILGRRLYMMKKKSQALQMKVTLDDKKVSQFMRRTARLNEAFSVVKRVPVIRPSLPAAGGLTQWPVMSLR